MSRADIVRRMPTFKVTTRTGVDRDYFIEAATRDDAWRYVREHHGELTPHHESRYANQVYMATESAPPDVRPIRP